MICRPAGKWPCRMERVAVSHTAAATWKHRVLPRRMAEEKLETEERVEVETQLRVEP